MAGATAGDSATGLPARRWRRLWEAMERQGVGALAVYVPAGAIALVLAKMLGIPDSAR